MKLVFFFICFLMGGLLIAQPARLILPSEIGSKTELVQQTASSFQYPYFTEKSSLASYNWPQELTLGSTFYDQQSSSPAGRLLVFNDGTMAAVWTMAFDTLSFEDIGTAYSYFDGVTWTEAPTARVESLSTRNPVIVQHGGGEAILSERMQTGALHFCSRPVKGEGPWSESDLPLPAGAVGFVGPKMVSSGLNHAMIHVLAVTPETATGGSLYHGQDGALVYYRSTDGGINWDIQGEVLPATDSSQYNGFKPETFAFAEPKGNQLAFVVGDPWSDLFLMKSSDNGANWQKTVIWQHPYPFWNGEATDSIYCPDGSVHLAFDNSGKIHVVFGLTRLYSDGEQVFRFPFVGGIGHWVEGMPAWIGLDQMNCLNPDSLDASGNLACSYLLDWNGNGQLDFLWNFGNYSVGPISHPQIAFDQYGVGMLVMSSVTEAYNDDIQDYRHIWYRYFYQGQVGNIAFDWNNQPQHLYHECVYPSLGSRSPDNLGWPFIYQMDGVPGIAVSGNQASFTENFINRVDLQYMLPDPIVTVNLYPTPPEGGAVEGGGNIFYGSSVTIAAHPNPGWEFVNWTSENVVFSTDTLVTFDALWNYDLMANFRLKTSLPDETVSLFTLYPNPARGNLSVRFTSSGTRVTNLKLYSLYSTLVREWKFEQAKEMVLNLKGVPPGMYTLQVTGNRLNQVRKVIVANP